MAGIMLQNVNNAISRRVNQLCQEREWSYYRLAMEAGVSKNTIYTIANGKRESVSANTLALICEACSISLEDFFAVGFSDIPSQE